MAGSEGMRPSRSHLTHTDRPLLCQRPLLTQTHAAMGVPTYLCLCVVINPPLLYADSLFVPSATASFEMLPQLFQVSLPGVSILRRGGEVASAHPASRPAPECPRRQREPARLHFESWSHLIRERHNSGVSEHKQIRDRSVNG